MKRMDGASPMTANLCIEKAKCSAMSRRYQSYLKT
jgi:uncharacterized protein GlcG (DUF336 family)